MKSNKPQTCRSYDIDRRPLAPTTAASFPTAATSIPHVVIALLLHRSVIPPPTPSQITMPFNKEFSRPLDTMLIETHKLVGCFNEDCRASNPSKRC
eukprot:scaffold3754_cov134-Skeletonema_dohrnii-CCMP3373.AAC.3